MIEIDLPTDLHPLPRGDFAPTRWSVVLEARGDDSRKRPALEKLCHIYWRPVYSFLRRHGHSPTDAEDTTQEFFFHLVSGDFFDRPDPARGRFRSYLIGALRNFVGHQREHATAVKRGGRVKFVALGTTDGEREFAAVAHPDLDPSEAYELSWAVTVLGEALQKLANEQHAAGRDVIFSTLKPFLHRSASVGDYEHAAKTLNTSRATVAVWLHRLTARLAELVKLEVAATLENPDDADQELRHLLAVFRR